MSEIINLNTEQLQNLHLIELEMLIEVDRICHKNKIEYSLDGGTLLGAIRHKGFIPWDDDLDVMFTHENYEKFYEACKKDLDTSRFFFQDFRTDSNYRWGYGKIRRLNTEYVKKGQEKMKQKTGVCIDVFDYQNLPDNEDEKKRYKRKMFCIRKIMYSDIGKYAADKLYMRMWYKICNIIPIGIVQKQRLSELNKLNNMKTHKMSCEMFPTPRKKDGISSSVFEDYIEVEFEGMKFMAVKDFDQYLKISYGNYMELPPVEKRKGVMNAVKYKFISLNYQDLLNEYLRNRGR